jgi:hypothetical protein
MPMGVADLRALHNDFAFTGSNGGDQPLNGQA